MEDAESTDETELEIEKLVQRIEAILSVSDRDEYCHLATVLFRDATEVRYKHSWLLLIEQLKDLIKQQRQVLSMHNERASLAGAHGWDLPVFRAPGLHDTQRIWREVIEPRKPGVRRGETGPWCFAIF